MKFMYGDILDVKSGVIIHQVNCQNKMGAGLALQILRKYPDVKTKYHKFCDTCLPAKRRLGVCLPVRVSDDLIIVNAFGQFYYGNAMTTKQCYTDMDALVNCIKKTVEHYPGKTCYIPWGIGCGLAGGDWDEIQKRLVGVDVTCVIRPEDVDPEAKI